ncbi:MAG: hypothetical protein ABI083_08150 [Lapillicoccus sp.]
MHRLQQLLPSLTRGEGSAETSFGGYRPVVGGPVPERARSDDDPRDRYRHLVAATRRIGRSMPSA